MSDRYDITCECDYTNRVPSHALGTTRECVNCSADLFIDPDKAVAVADKSDADHERRLREAMAAGKTTEFVRRPDSSSFAALSQPDTASPAKPPTQQPMKHNPFADEDAEEDDSPFAVPSAPPSRVEDVEPAPSRSRYVEIPTISSLDKATGETCASCGRALRGEWDRVETPEGVICYICSNQATESIPERIKDRPEPKLTNEPAVLYDVPERERTDTNKSLFGIDTESEGFKRFVFAIAVATILLAVGVWMMGDSTPTPSVSSAFIESDDVQDLPPIPKWVNGVILLWQVVGAYATVFLALYVTCNIGPGLPHDSFKHNAVFFMIALAIMTLMEGIYFGVGAALTSIPIAGTIWWMLARAVLGLIYIGMFINMFDFRIRDFFIFIIVVAVAQAIVQSLSMFFYAGLASLVL